MSETKVIVAIDIGSSSVRCSAYQLLATTSNAKESPVKALDNCRSSRLVRSVQPNTGKIQLLGSQDNDDDPQNGKSLMDNLDESMDELLGILRNTLGQGGFQVVAVGFSSFVMNLVGVDSNGSFVGDEASISYACNSPHVAQQCRNLRR